MTNLSLAVNPTEFFREQLLKALQKQNVILNDEVEFYVVNLLCEFISQTKLTTGNEEIDLLNTPLALLLKKALESPMDEQIRVYKAVGDTSLYISGYFQDYFNDKTFSLDYFIGIGSNAYSSASNLIRELYRDRNGAATYINLAENFRDIVELVAEISDNLGPKKPENLLATYDKWQRNQNSDRLRRKLEDHGIVAQPVNFKISQ